MAAGDRSRDPVIADYQVAALIAGMLRAAAITRREEHRVSLQDHLADAEDLIGMAREQQEAATPSPDPEAMLYEHEIPADAFIVRLDELERWLGTFALHWAYWAHQNLVERTIRYDARISLDSTPDGVIPPGATHVIILDPVFLGI